MTIERHYAAVDDAGRVLQSVRMLDADDGTPEPPAGAFTYYLLPEPLDWSLTTETCWYMWIEDAAVLVETATLDEARAKAWERIKSARDVAEASDFTCAGLIYQADKARISGAALAALMAQVAGAPYSIDWTLSDNSVTTLSAAQMSAVGVALMEHVDSAFSIARGLRVLIDAASAAELPSITWPAAAGVGS